MKKLKELALLSVIALMGAVGFTACSSSDDVVEVNPTYDGTSVKTDFAINIPYSSESMTRMGATETQENKNFRGMQNIFLVPTSFFVADANNNTSAVTSNNYFNNDLLTLGDIVPYSESNATGVDNTQSSHIYKDFNINVGTTNFLFYGEAKPADAITDNAGKQKYGVLSSSLVENENSLVNIKKATDIVFGLEPILGAADEEAFSDAQTKLAKIMNDVRTASFNDADNDATDNDTWATKVNELYTTNGVPQYNNSGELVANGNVDATSYDDRWLGLAELYFEYIRVSDTQVRAGSANSVMETLRMLYDNVWLLRQKVHDTLESDNNTTEKPKVQALYDCCDAILKAIVGTTSSVPENGVVADGKNFSTTANEGWVESGASDPTAIGYMKKHFTFTWNTELGTNVTAFPTSFNLPEGVAQIRYKETDEAGETVGFYFKANDKIAFGGDKDNLVTVDVMKIVHPASLMYYANSPLKATNVEILEDRTNNYDETNLNLSAWPTSVKGWDTERYWNSWIDVVRSTTRSIAMRNNIQYGVARMAITVKCGAATLEDNSKENVISGSGAIKENLKIDVPADGFPLKGVLVGGQPTQAGWDLMPANASNGYDTNAGMDFVVYDNDINNITAKDNTTSDKNYTLLLDNYDATNAKVNIALEFENNSGKDFYGMDGLIRNGQKFYLIGQIDAADKTLPEDSSWPSGTYLNRYPANNKMRAFMQDYTTTANFTITSLQKAYVTIPDLRVTKLQFGVSVDLVWQKGITYNIEL